VKLDMLPRGLDCICVSISVPKNTEGAIDGMVCESFIEEKNVLPTAVTEDCHAG
jgi:hypothetical protein